MARTRSSSLPRTAALVALGAMAVHQLRYLVAYPGDAGHQLAEQGHGYLLAALPVIAGFAVAALAACVMRGALGGESARDRGRGAPAYAVAIILVFSLQEVMEGALSPGHAAGLAAIFAHGGWLALPLALLVGWLCSVLDRGVRRLERIAAAALVRRHRAARPRSAGRPRDHQVSPRAAAPLAFGLARRPPPIPAR
jgi:hypothetical protein